MIMIRAYDMIPADRLEVGGIYYMKRNEQDEYEKVMVSRLPDLALPPPRNKRVHVQAFKEGDPEDQATGISMLTTTDNLYMKDGDVDMGAARRRRRTTRRRKTAHKKRKTVSKRK